MIGTSRSDTIVAIATGVGGAIAVIRVGGERAIEVCDAVFASAVGKPLANRKGYTMCYGTILDRQQAQPRVIDDVVVSLFRSPNSYTGEDMVEISCHGSSYIQKEIVKVLIASGARNAEAGEFTIRAFLNGKLDLSQAEAVADMIASTDRATHALASQQMRGGYSNEIQVLRDKLVELVALLELELDFSEEDVVFADREELKLVIANIESKISLLLNSFDLGNSLKSGVAVAIVGKPNVGKSTLLNALLKEDRAMVSQIAGTTRDVIEESLNVDGVRFRFIDTAGIRETSDVLEQMGIERTYDSIARARIVLFMIDAQDIATPEDVLDSIKKLNLDNTQKLCLVVNKIDTIGSVASEELLSNLGNTTQLSVVGLAAKTGSGVEKLLAFLSEYISAEPLYSGDTVVSNVRHYESFCNAQLALERAQDGLSSNLPADLLSQDVRESLHHLGTITGEITSDDILSTIFSKFCIGK